MKRIYIRTISSLLALLILFTSMDMSAFAYEADDALEAFVSTESDDETEMTEPEEGVSEELPSVDDEDFDSLSDTEDETSIDRAEEGDESSILGTDDDGSAVTSGSCGDNLTWVLTGPENELTLHISGTGSMYDYDYVYDQFGYSDYYHNTVPWEEKKREIVACVIDQGVTRIGKCAFCLCDRLMSVELPSTLTSIGEEGFSKCDWLTEIELPPALTSIGIGAFYDCRNLTSIAIPTTVTSIGDAAFALCSSLASIEIPATVTSIGDYAFSSCKFTNIELPPTLTSIGEGMFSNCTNLTGIKIPATVTSIGNYAFHYCKSLTIVVAA